MKPFSGILRGLSQGRWILLFYHSTRRTIIISVSKVMKQSVPRCTMARTHDTYGRFIYVFGGFLLLLLLLSDRPTIKHSSILKGLGQTVSLSPFWLTFWPNNGTVLAPIKHPLTAIMCKYNSTKNNRYLPIGLKRWISPTIEEWLKLKIIFFHNHCKVILWHLR